MLKDNIVSETYALIFASKFNLLKKSFIENV